MYQDQDQPIEEIEIEAIGIEISSQPIELYKIFKIANLVGGGGEAKHLISEGYVAVNGELETRKRRKIYDGDLIEFNQEFYLVICDTAPEEEVKTEFHLEDNPQPASTAQAKPEPEGKKAGKPGKKEKKEKAEKSKGKERKSIQFF